MHMLDSRQPGFDAALRQLLAFETAKTRRWTPPSPTSSPARKAGATLR